jgi:hypothetical protein
MFRRILRPFVVNGISTSSNVAKGYTVHGQIQHLCCAPVK